MSDEIIVQEKEESPSNGALDRNAFEKWILVLSNGKYFLGFPAGGKLDHLLLKPVFEALFIHVPNQTGGINTAVQMVFPHGLSSVTEIKIPQGAIMAPVAAMFDEEKRMLFGMASAMIENQKRALAARSGTPRIQLARG